LAAAVSVSVITMCLLVVCRSGVASR
jgi:hypothetical protein